MCRQHRHKPGGFFDGNYNIDIANGRLPAAQTVWPLPPAQHPLAGVSIPTSGWQFPARYPDCAVPAAFEGFNSSLDARFRFLAHARQFSDSAGYYRLFQVSQRGHTRLFPEESGFTRLTSGTSSTSNNPTGTSASNRSRKPSLPVVIISAIFQQSPCRRREFPSTCPAGE